MVDVKILAQIDPSSLSQMTTSIKQLGKTPVLVQLDASSSIQKIVSDLKAQLKSIPVGVSVNSTFGVGNGGRSNQKYSNTIFQSYQNKIDDLFYSFDNKFSKKTQGSLIDQTLKASQAVDEFISKRTTASKLVADTEIKNTKRAFAEQAAMQKTYKQISDKSFVDSGYSERFEKAQANIVAMQHAIDSAQKVAAKGTGDKSLDGYISNMESKLLAYKNALSATGTEDVISMKSQKQLSSAAKEMASAYSTMQTGVKKYKKELEGIEVAQDAIFNTEKIRSKAQEQMSIMDTYRSKWSKLFKDKNMSSQFENIYSEFNNLSTNGGTQAEMDAIVSKMKIFTNQAKISRLATKTWGDSFKSAFASISRYFSAAQVIGWIRQGVQTMVQNVKDINASMTDLQKVSEGSDTVYNNYRKDAAKRAADMSTSMTSYIQGTTGFARTGETLKDAQKLGEVATIYYNVGDGVTSVEDATNSLISTMRAFNLEANQAMSIADKTNLLGNTFAVKSGQLGSIMQGAGSAMAAAGNDLDQSLAMATGMTEVNQNAENTAATLKVAALRIRGASKALEEMGEDTDSVVTSQSKLRDEIKLLTGGFDIMDSKGNYKSFFEQMRGIAKSYNEMDSASPEAARLLELISGKSRSSNMAGMLQNWDQVEKAYVASQGADGSAMKEYSKWEKSLDAKSKKLEATTQRASQALIGDGAVGAAYDGLTGLLTLFSNLTETAGGFTTTVGLLSAVLAKVTPNLGIAKVQYAPLREIPVAA